MNNVRKYSLKLLEILNRGLFQVSLDLKFVGICNFGQYPTSLIYRYLCPAYNNDTKSSLSLLLQLYY